MAERQKKSGDRKENVHRRIWWTGDVWRCALALKRHRRDLRIVALDAKPTGLILITHTDGKPDLVRSRYGTLLKEMGSFDLARITIKGLHDEMEVRPTASFELEQFRT